MTVGESKASGRFEIVRKLGQGGMGVVFEAFDRECNEHIALKSLSSLTPSALRALKNEFRAVSEITHPNLVTLGELIEDSGQWYLTMELVRGVSFLHHVRAVDVDIDAERSTSSADSTSQMSMKASRSTPIEESDLTSRLETYASVSASKAAGVVSSGLASGAPGTGGSRARRFDEARLRESLAQLVRGLRALHIAERVHCDIKPSNVMVTHEGRVVVLDFGLAVPIGSRLVQDGGRLITGTFQYMSPEHAAGKPVDATSDWYSVGIMLFEALTGVRPFRGDPLQVSLLKQELEPPAPLELFADIPEDLNALCTALLRIDPTRRPSSEELERRVHVRGSAGPVRLINSFIGRAAELAELERAADEARAGRSVVVVVEGESGLGKSALVEHFIHRLRGTTADAWILSGRCVERESVPYKAFDGVLDELAHRLLELPREQLARVLPGSLPLIAKSFAVLADLPGASVPHDQPADPRELQTQLFNAIRDLLTSVATQHSVVVVINDLQWSDVDSLALLREVLREPAAPPLLMLITSRTSRSFEQLQEGGAHVRRLRLDGLAQPDSEALVRAALGGSSSETYVARIITESGGHPMFLRELVRYAQAGGPAPQSAGTLDDALNARIQQLEPTPKRILELSALNGQPVTHEVMAHTMGLDLVALRRSVEVLRAQQLVQTTGRRSTDTLEPYHDRIRETAVAHLSPDYRRECHRALAGALEASGRGDSQLLASHWEGAGDALKAAQHYRAAADEARAALAFGLAASFYRKVQALAPPGGEAQVELRARLAEALVHAGAADASIPEFQEAARLTGDPSLALDLKRRAMEQMLRTGNTDGGIAVLSDILKAVSDTIPAPQRAARGLRWARLRLKLRGMRYVERPESECPVNKLRRMDLYWSATVGFYWINPVLGFYFNSKILLECLTLGEPVRVTRAQALHVFAQTALGEPWPKVDAFAREVWAKAEALHDQSAMVWCDYSHAFAAFDHGHYALALELTERAERLLVSECTGMDLEHAYIRWLAARTRALLGEWGAMARMIPQFLRQAQERGDRMTGMMLSTGLCCYAWLVLDRPEVARELAAVPLKTMTPTVFRTEHVTALFACCLCDLYEGRWQDAVLRVEELTRRFFDSRMSRQKSALYFVQQLRGVCALSALRDPHATKSALDIARSSARLMRRYRTHSALGEALLLEGAIALHQRGRRAARECLEAADRELLAGHRHMLAAAARWRLGELIGGDAGRALVERSQELMHEQSIVRPRRMLDLIAPGLQA